MRVMWFTNVPLDAVNRHFGRPTTGGGFWMHALIEPLLATGQIELAVVTASTIDPAYHFTDGGVDYFGIPQHRALEKYAIASRHRLGGYLKQAANLVNRWRPDLLHVHGTERFFGLVRARRLVDVPTIVSIQGLVGQCAPVARGTMNWRDLLLSMTIGDLLRANTPLSIQRRFRRQAPLEQQIIRGADAVIGRTDWDRAHVRAINPGVTYFAVQEMLRPEFRAARSWSLADAQCGLLLTTSSLMPLKGLPLLLQAVAHVRRWGHDVHLRVAGVDRKLGAGGLARYVRSLVRSLGIADHVEFLGWQDAAGLAGHMQRAHCFITPSLIENSCNALAEAQSIGMPCIATHAGGLSSMIADGQTGLLFARGDAAMLAANIERILLDDALARRLGHAARDHARPRHDPSQILADLLAAYAATLRAGSSARSAAVPVGSQDRA